MKTHFAFSICILMLAFSCQNNEHWSLLNPDGQNYIQVSTGADSLEIRSADLLGRYLKEITGKSFEIVNSANVEGAKIKLIKNSADLEEHTIKYQSQESCLLLEGGTGKSLMNCVYTFLENELGCRYYSPTVSKIPSQNDILISNNLYFEYTPPIQTRTVHSKLFYDNHDFADALKVTHEAFPTYAPNARVHTFHKFLPAEVYYSTHPEYFALRNGKRITTQLCLTNENVLTIVKDSVAAIKNRYPNAKVISVSQDDNTQYCQCVHCEEIHEREESAAGSMIYFVNAVAEAFPDIQISTLAYQYTRKAPKNIKPRENVLITLCSIECDRSAPIAEKCAEFSDDLIAWGKLTDNIRIWDYTTQFTNFLAPFPNLHTLQPNLQLFKRNNAKWVFEQHSNQPSELFELRSYLTAKLLWDPDLDVSSVRTDFLTGYYGKAGSYIDDYLNEIHDRLQMHSTFFLFLYGDPSQGFSSFLNLTSLMFYDSLFDQAHEEVKHDPELVTRVNLARLSIDYAILEFAKTDLKNAQSNAFFNVSNRLKRFKQTCASGSIRAMNEMGYSVDDYLGLYDATLARASLKNLALDKNVSLLTKPKKYANENPQVLTDGAYGGASFYSNWLGFEGNDMVAIIDLSHLDDISHISTAFLQVTNHIVFFPDEIELFGSADGAVFTKIATLENKYPLQSTSRINDVQYFESSFPAKRIRYIKLIAKNPKVAPDWHHASGLPAWIFCDEVVVN